MVVAPVEEGAGADRGALATSGASSAAWIDVPPCSSTTAISPNRIGSRAARQGRTAEGRASARALWGSRVGGARFQRASRRGRSPLEAVLGSVSYRQRVPPNYRS